MLVADSHLPATPSSLLELQAAVVVVVSTATVARGILVGRGKQTGSKNVMIVSCTPLIKCKKLRADKRHTTAFVAPLTASTLIVHIYIITRLCNAHPAMILQGQPELKLIFIFNFFPFFEIRN